MRLSGFGCGAADPADEADGSGALLLTNASGGINPSFSAGDLMLLTDHISLFCTQSSDRAEF